MDDHRLTTHDRLQQTSWLRELAGNIAQNLADGDVTAEEVVDYALSEEGEMDWGISIPQWFDQNDRRLLTRMVERRIA